MESKSSTSSQMTELYPQYSLMELKFWITRQDLIPELSDHALDVFLHSCFHNIKDTKKTITSFYSLRLKTPQFFLDRNEDVINLAGDRVFCLKLSGTTKEGYKVFIMGLPSDDPHQFMFSDIVKFCIMALEMWIFNDNLYPGIVVLLDSKHFTFSHLKKTNIRMLKTLFLYFQDALAARLKKLLILNISKPMDVAFNLVEPVLSKRLIDLIEKYGKHSTKYLNYVPEDILPVEYKGNGENISSLQAKTIAELKEKLNWFHSEDDILKSIMENKPRKNGLLNSINKIFS